jgi:hypothetical protein
LLLDTVAIRHSNLAAEIGGSANADVEVTASKLEFPAKILLSAGARKDNSLNAHLSKGNSSKSNVCNLHDE